MDEKRFTMLDRVLRPDLYLWLKASEFAMVGVGQGYRDIGGRGKGRGRGRGRLCSKVVFFLCLLSMTVSETDR